MITNFVIEEKMFSSKIQNYYLTNYMLIKDIGLFHGKTGICIYFYYLAQKTGNELYRNKANELIDDIFSVLNNSSGNSIETGITGIGIGFIYLIKNGYVYANYDELLEEFDSKIFQDLHFNLINSKENNFKSLFDFLCYFFLRVKTRVNKENCDVTFILEQSIVFIINKIDNQCSGSMDIFDEPAGFQLFWRLPLFLTLLCEIHQLGIYRYKIERILQELSYSVLSLIPLLHSHRLSLVCAIKKVTSHIYLPLWESHLHLLLNSINYDHIINNELKNKQLYLENGLVGIYTIILLWEKLSKRVISPSVKKQIIIKLKNTEIWEDDELFDNLQLSKAGGIAGLLGVDLLIKHLTEAK